MAVFTFTVLLLGFLQVPRGSNVLIFSGYGEGSHFMSAALVGKELMRRDHNITALISNAYEYRANETKYIDLKFEIFKHNVPPEEVRVRHERFTESIFRGTWLRDILLNATTIMNWFIDDCQALFDDKPLLQRLLEAKFDVAFIDPLWPCSLLVAEYSAKRHVSFMATTWMNNVPSVNGNPSNAAFVPEGNNGFTNHMTLIQRALNCIMGMVNKWTLKMSDSHTALQHANGIYAQIFGPRSFTRGHNLFCLTWISL
ncbi:UDP-glucuronosyltransferase 1-6-like [Lytechinus pictus]|uniref:UDP-glucuronosyltransferase 1-6-like n=1 Tax=Lytechinus pictus TaxID=7653 RepID=UPI0030B9B227